MASYPTLSSATVSGKVAPSSSNKAPANAQYQASPQNSDQIFRINRVLPVKQPEPSPEYLDQLYGIKRVSPANRTFSQPAKKRKVQKEVDYNENDEIAVAKAQASLGGKNDYEQGTWIFNCHISMAPKK